MPETIRALFAKKIDRHIEGVIKADDESDLKTEISEYVVTKEIARRLDEFLGAYLAGGASNGVWIAGFFGSGKSHLLKILSLLLENQSLGDTQVSDLFLPKLAEDPMLKADLEKALRIPSRSVRFNIDQKADLIAKDQLDALLAVFVKVFNELRGYYPKQGYIAELEAELDLREQFSPFKAAYLEESRGRAWEEDRDFVHTLENETFARAYAKVTGMAYSEALQALDRKQAAYKVSIESFGESVQQWLERQPANFRLNFFVDEVGQFIGTNSKLMLNLQTVAETLATKCKGRAWLFVTSQGDLETVIGAMGASANDFTKITGRFKTLLNLTSQDVAEVICRRLLEKEPILPPALEQLYIGEGNNLKTLFQFGDSQNYVGYQDAAEFSAFYPFHPYQFELLQKSLIALSKHGFFTGRQRSIGERSMLGILQDVLKAIADRPVGKLAAFDGMFEGIRNALRADLQTSIQTAERNLGGSSALPVRLLKALFLVKFVQQFKATLRNLAILLIDQTNPDITAHEKAVQTALNLLEQQIYIQRNGDVYEFLTNEEQAVEAEIKDTEVDESDVAEQLGKVLYDHILGETKYRFKDNEQDYSVTRRLDGQVYKKREYDLAFHIASPFHESYGEPISLIAQSMGKSELLIILPEDPHLLTDLRLYLQTEKYARQNLSSTLPEVRRRIIVDKQQRNADRLSNLHDRLSEGLVKARLVLNGNDLSVNSVNPKDRLARAFQELVRYAFPSLKMIRRQFAEIDLKTTLTTPADDFFKNDDGTMGEAEQEILLKLKLARDKGERVTVADQLAAFEKRTYGWPQIATLCLTARLFMRGKIELRNGGNLLSAEDALPALSNNRQFNSTVITLQEQFDATAVTKLKKFHQEFFNAPNPFAEARDAAQELQKRLREYGGELETLASHAGSYPFLAALTPWVAELKSLAEREWSHCLKNLPEFSERLLDAKEDVFDSLKQFYAGSKRTIYDEIRHFLRDQAPNFPDIDGEEIAELQRVMSAATPYKGNIIQQAKTSLGSLRAKVDAAVVNARTEALARVQASLESLQAVRMEGKMGEDDAHSVLDPFKAALAKIQTEPLAPVIRQIADRIANETLPRQLEELSRQATKGVKGGPTQPETRYIAAKSIKVPFPKPVLESEADLDAYLAAVRSAYAVVMENGVRVTL